MFIVLLETSGNQHYIFSTNKLRENVGASELTYQIGTRIVAEEVGRNYKYKEDKDGNLLKKLLLNENPIESSTDKDKVEIIIATSGKSLLVTNTKEKAEEIISNVTRRALIEMPGLTVHGAIIKFEKLEDIHQAIGQVHQKLEENRFKLPSNLQRFQRLPFVEPCATSGLPASEIKLLGTDIFAFSPVTLAKRQALAKVKDKIEKENDFDKGRIITLLEKIFEIQIPQNVEKLEERFPKIKWLSVIHADGNGLGEIFLKFNDKASTKDGRDYIDKYRKFSIALDICTINAAGYALKEMQIAVTSPKSKHYAQEGIIPAIPIILGGDDLTLICDGEYALKFVKDFLEQFERETQNLNKTPELKGYRKDEFFKEIVEKLRIEDESSQKDIIPYIAKNTFGVPRLGICAGIAIIKPHYPFHSAYTIAESLLKSAKQVKKKVLQADGKTQIPCLALDFHIHYNSSGSDLDLEREKLKTDDGKTLLYKKPYVVSTSEEVLKNDWVKNRKFEDLKTKVEAMQNDKEDEELPNSQLHIIRESLFYGKTIADAEANLIAHRYGNFNNILEGKKEKANADSKNSIFINDEDKKITGFLDALELVEFWQKEENPKTVVNGGQA